MTNPEPSEEFVLEVAAADDGQLVGPEHDRRSLGGDSDEAMALGPQVAALIRAAFINIGGDDIEWLTGSASGEFGESVINAEVHLEAGAWFGEVSVEFDGADSARMASLVMAALIGIPLRSWKLSPEKGLLRISAQVTLWQLRDAQANPESLHAHRSRRLHHVVRRVDGEHRRAGSMLRALCGYEFIAVHEGDDDAGGQPCPVCVVVFEILRELHER